MSTLEETIAELDAKQIGPREIRWNDDYIGVPAKVSKHWHFGPNDYYGVPSFNIDFEAKGWGQGIGHFGLESEGGNTPEESKEVLDRLLNFVRILGPMQHWTGRECWVLYKAPNRYGQSICGVGVISSSDGNKEYIWGDA